MFLLTLVLLVTVHHYGQGYLGNKGAVAVRLEVGGRSSLCFVCVHMAAHREQVLARNAEYKLISSKPVFADTDGR